MKIIKTTLILLAIGLLGLIGFYILRNTLRPARYLKLYTWMRDPQAHADWTIKPGQNCGDAPFVMPTTGIVGYIWGDTFKIGHRHEGIDIFGGTQAGVTPVYAAYDGYLTRESTWKSAVIIRIPNDPLQPGRQIWIYYAHMADQDGKSFISEAFPPDTHEVFVKAGTLLGYQGNYSGTPNNPVGVHLHFSVVKDNGSGKYLNELDIANTLDPSPYFGLPLNSKTNADTVPVCSAATAP
jgi:murein DD-endopeptidase MepM/ murein hydrolase activator NlpD